MKVDGLIFDLDGTLADTVPDIATSMAHAMSSTGLPPATDKQVRRAVGAGVTVLVERLVRDASKRAAVLKAFLAHYADHLVDATTLYPGVPETLDALAPLPMSIVTNKPEGLSRTIVAKLGIARHFRAIVGGDSLPMKKPDPLALAPALSALGGSRPLLVGDSGIDLATARAAGIAFVAVTYGYHGPGELDGAAQTVDSFSELVSLLR